MPIPRSYNELILKMHELPDELRSFLASADVVESIEEIQKDHALSESATIDLSRIIAWYVAGFLNAQELAGEIAKIAPPGKLAEFRGDIIKKIFTPFSTQLHAHGLNFEMILTTAPASFVTPEKPPTPTALPKTSPPTPPPVVISEPSPEISPAAKTVPTIPVTPPAPTTAAPPATPPKPPEKPPQPTPVIPPKPTQPTTTPRITISSQQPTVPTTPQKIPEKPKEETVPKTIRYTPPPVIPEVPKIISPAGRTTPGVSIKPFSGQKSSGAVIDLSTFKITNLEQSQTDKPQNIEDTKK